ncbi:hypothetical protein [Solirubrobacter soli]|uniref:hypothetical protein n=1 Tax=Solirubrobacter soli TaxID=363832 RepID=UPI00042144A1|nr:hypothetical protein [Solirubrobacter soli]
MSAPAEVFPMWHRAQFEAERLALCALPAPSVLRTTELLRAEVAEAVAEWFLAPMEAPGAAVLRAYRALERDVARLFEVIRGSLAVRVRYVRTEDEPYSGGAELCAELRSAGTMTLRTIACEPPHPLLGGVQGGVVDQLRVVHDVFGHAALGVGFDLDAEFNTWLQCRALFSPVARPAAFCELVGAVTAYVVTGTKPGLVAKVAPPQLLGACADRTSVDFAL